MAGEGDQTIDIPFNPPQGAEGMAAQAAARREEEIRLRKKRGGFGFNFRKKLPHASTLVDALKQILESWEMKDYASDRERWQSYTEDIAMLVEDSGSTVDEPTVGEGY